MQSSICWVIGVTLSTSMIPGQQKSNDQIKVLTVCEVLGDLPHYADKAVAVVGRMERSVSLADHSEFLSQDRCQHPVVTHGHVWPDKIQILADWEAGMPKPPSERPNLERSVVAARLSTVRKTTKLGFHQEPKFKADGRSITHAHAAAVPNEWAVVYGRIVPVPNLNKDCGAGGCGGNDVPLVIITEPYNVHRLSANARPLPDE